jgi:hypothetical protein
MKSGTVSVAARSAPASWRRQVAGRVSNLWRRSVLMRLPYHNPMFWMVLMLLVAPIFRATDPRARLRKSDGHSKHFDGWPSRPFVTLVAFQELFI